MLTISRRSEDASQYGHAGLHPQPPSMKRFGTGSVYDDGYSDIVSTYDYDQPLAKDSKPLDSPAVDNNHKLLLFSPPELPYTLLDFAYRRTSISLTAQLHGMFFLAEPVWPAAEKTTAPVNELTCYRRNLFQISGSLTLPRGLRYILTEQGEQIPIIGQELTVMATESVEGNPVKLISVPWKTPATGTPAVEDKTEKEPTSMPIDLASGQDVDQDFVSFPVSWKRLQFRIATANNGRRKELQQHFVVRVKVMSTLANGARIPLCEVRSNAIIVRGRSPRNFQSRKDLPISGSGAPGRRTHHLLAQPSKTSTGDGHKAERLGATQIEIPQIPFPYDPSEMGVSPDFFKWEIPVGQVGAMTAIPPEISLSIPQGNAYAQSSPDLSRQYPVAPRTVPKPPINLSLLDDEKNSNPSNLPTPNPLVGVTGNSLKRASTSPTTTPARKVPRITKPPVERAPSFTIGLLSGGGVEESADLLYEYFPLGLDDWMPPVDAVYRPHVVHHTNLPSDPKSLAVKNRSKRYFSEDQP
jgi:hypothetical protein